MRSIALVALAAGLAGLSGLVGTRGEASDAADAATGNDLTDDERRACMTWAQRLKRVFHIDIETCPACGGQVRIIVCIEDPVVIRKIRDHLKEKEGDYTSYTFTRPHCRPTKANSRLAMPKRRISP